MSLRQTLKDKKGLFTTSQEELSSLREKVTTPQEAKVTGGSPDMAKMAGTPAQTKSAIRAGIEGAQDLQAFQRRGGPQQLKEETAAEKATREKFEKIAQLGQVSQALPDIVANRFSLDTVTPSTLELVGELDIDEAIKTKITTNPASLTGPELATIAAELGLEKASDITEEQFGQQVKAALKLGDDTLAEQIAADVAGEVMVTELDENDLASMGFASVEELADALGIAPEDVSEMSLNDLEGSLETMQADMFDQAAEARAILNDDNATAAQKKAAQEALGRFSKLGIEDLEVQVSDIQRQIEEGKTLEFDGQMVKLDELLDSSEVELKVMGALSSEEKMAELKENEPELHAFIEAHKAAFEQMVGALDEQVVGFIETNEANMQQAKIEDLDIEMTEDEMNLLYDFKDGETFNQVRDEKLDTPPMLEFLKDTSIPENERKAMHYFVQQLTENNLPQIQRELKYLKKEDLRNLGFYNTADVKAYIDNQKQIMQMDNMLSAKDYDGIAQTYFGEANLDSIKKKVQKALQINSSGFGRIEGMQLGLWDANQDGTMDPMSQIVDRMRGKYKTSLHQLLNSGKKLRDSQSPILNQYNFKEPDSAVYKKVGKYFSDGKIDNAELSKITRLRAADLYELYSKNPEALTSKQKSTIRSSLVSKYTTDMTRNINGQLMSGTWSAKFQGMNWGSINKIRETYNMVQEAKRTNPAAKLGSQEKVTDLLRFASHLIRTASGNRMQKTAMYNLANEIKRLARGMR